MSIKSRVVSKLDDFYIWRLQNYAKTQKASVDITPVFHVERLYVDEYFDGLLRFSEEFILITGARPVLTCMTPISPILNTQLSEYDFSHSKYLSRIARLKNCGIIGLHGHFIRGFDQSGKPMPMHCFFCDLTEMKKQISLELEILRSSELFDENFRVYSGGWWFTSSGLRRILVEQGFYCDYSISSSSFNRSQGSDALELIEVNGAYEQKLSSGSLRSPIAVSSISKRNRPNNAFGKIWMQRRRQNGERFNISLYSHDYDLDVVSALSFTQAAVNAGLRFSEPDSSFGFGK